MSHLYLKHSINLLI